MTRSPFSNIYCQKDRRKQRGGSRSTTTPLPEKVRYPLSKGDGFLRSHAINPTVPSTLGNPGLCYAYLADKTSAFDALDRTLEVDPKYEVARQNRVAIEKLEEGEALPTPHRAINDLLKGFPEMFGPRD